MEPSSAQVALVSASAAHAGFQLTVSAVVYPALARVPAPQWTDAHLAHGRAIAPLVGLLYVVLGVTGLWALLSAPGDPWLWLACTGAAVSGLVTAFVAAPTHAALGRERTESAVRRLLLADRVRSLGAIIALVGALVAVLGTW